MTKKEIANRRDLFQNKCKKHNLKITPQRSVIYDELLKSKDHPYADIIYKIVRKIFPNISFDTVNRTLLTFSKIGVVDIVEGYGDPKRFDPNIDSHNHFRCIKCNNIIDFYFKPYNTIKIPATIAKQFTILSKKVVLEGICNKCKQ